jgi:hypothetical protein
MPPLRNDFASIAVMTPDLRKSADGGSHSAAAVLCLSGSHSFADTLTQGSTNLAVNALLRDFGEVIHDALA